MVSAAKTCWMSRRTPHPTSEHPAPAFVTHGVQDVASAAELDVVRLHLLAPTQWHGLRLRAGEAREAPRLAARARESPQEAPEVVDAGEGPRVAARQRGLLLLCRQTSACGRAEGAAAVTPPVPKCIDSSVGLRDCGSQAANWLRHAG